MPIGRLTRRLRIPSVRLNMFDGSSTQSPVIAVLSENRTNDVPEERNMKVFGEFRAVLREDEIPSQFPIGQLPFELLAEVSYWYIVMVHTRYGVKYPSTYPTPYCWLALGHVCHAWRLVVLNDPKLSTYICMTRIECVQEMLKRSANLPVFISETRKARDATDQILKLVLKHLPRIRAMALDVPYDILTSPAIPETLQSSVGELESLTLTIWQTRSDSSYPRTPIFPDMKFPKLLSLVWAYGNLRGIHTFLHPGLRRLNIRDTPRVSSAQLLVVLAQLRHLEELVLRNVCYNTELDDTGLSPKHVINLPGLRQLALYDDESEVGIHLLQQMVYPGTAAVTLMTLGAVSLYTFISSVIIAKLVGEGTLGAPPVSRSIYIQVDDTNLYLTLWEEMVPLDDMRAAHYTKIDGFKFQFLIDFAPGDDDWWFTFLQEIPMSSVRSALFVHNRVDANTSRWDRIVAKMPLIEQLGLTYECYGMDDDRCEDGSKDVGNPIEAQLELLLPRLKVLRVRELHMQHHSEAVPHAFDLCRVSHKLTAMRAKTGSPFRRLDISVQHSCYGFRSANSSCVCGMYTSPPETTVRPQEIGNAVPSRTHRCRSVSSKVSRLFQAFGRGN